MPRGQDTKRAPKRKGSAQHRGPNHETPASRTKLREALKAACGAALAPIFGDVLPALTRPKGGVPAVEARAQREYARARRALRALLAAVPEGEVCGPCTAFVVEHRAAIVTLVRDDAEGLGVHWRQHSADRNTPTSLAVDVYGNMSGTFGGDASRRLTARELACISLLNNAPLRGDTVEAAIHAETHAIRAALKRLDKARHSAADRRA